MRACPYGRWGVRRQGRVFRAGRAVLRARARLGKKVPAAKQTRPCLGIGENRKIVTNVTWNHTLQRYILIPYVEMDRYISIQDGRFLMLNKK
jgi:hypothetical protein